MKKLNIDPMEVAKKDNQKKEDISFMDRFKYWAVFIPLLSVLVFGVLGTVNYFLKEPQGDTYELNPPPVIHTRSKVEVKKACEKHISDAERKLREIIASRSEHFADYILSCKTGSRPFGEEVTSWYGKWRLVKGFLPFTEKGGHKKFVAKQFGKYIFTKEEVDQKMRQTVANIMRDIEGVQNELAVQIKKEILNSSIEPSEIPVVQKEFDNTIESIIKASQWDVGKTVGNLIVSEVASSILGQIVAQMGVDAGILGTAAANSWETFGASLLVGIIVDMVWEWIDDPAGDIAVKVDESLDTMAYDSKLAIQKRMDKILEIKKRAWNEVVERDLKKL